MKLMKMNHGAAKRSPYARAVAWCVAAFALLATGVVAGAMAGKEWKWIFPVAGVVAYVLAMRHGLRVWSPDGLDLLWRSTPAARPRRTERRASSRPMRLRERNGPRDSMRPPNPHSSEEYGRRWTGQETA